MTGGLRAARQPARHASDPVAQSAIWACGRAAIGHSTCDSGPRTNVLCRALLVTKDFVDTTVICRSHELSTSHRNVSGSCVFAACFTHVCVCLCFTVCLYWSCSVGQQASDVACSLSNVLLSLMIRGWACIYVVVDTSVCTLRSQLRMDTSVRVLNCYWFCFCGCRNHLYS